MGGRRSTVKDDSVRHSVIPSAARDLLESAWTTPLVFLATDFDGWADFNGSKTNRSGPFSSNPSRKARGVVRSSRSLATLGMTDNFPPTAKLDGHDEIRNTIGPRGRI